MGDLLGACGRPGARGHHVGDPWFRRSTMCRLQAFVVDSSGSTKPPSPPHALTDLSVCKKQQYKW